MNFYFDENYGHKLASGLNEFDDKNTVRHFKDVDFLGLKDVTWFQKLPKTEKNIIITLDRSIRRNPAERLAWKESGAIMFFIMKSFAQLEPWDQIVKLVRKWPMICKLAAKASPGDGFIVHPNGEKIDLFKL